jgi:hypothetical protein
MGNLVFVIHRPARQILAAGLRTFIVVNEGGGASVSDAAPQPLGAASPGVSLDASRSDHAHAKPTPSEIGAATQEQGTKADSAVQLESLSEVAISGSYDDLSSKPAIPASPEFNFPSHVMAAIYARPARAFLRPEKSMRLSDARKIVAAALALLPTRMTSPQAVVQMLAIGLIPVSSL